jgi:DNA-binding helix-hairpin-helix protein with protein kinase domain
MKSSTVKYIRECNNSTVYVDQSKNIGSGGEGEIYRVVDSNERSTGEVVKIYKEITENHVNKLRVMIGMLHNEFIIWPTDLLKDENGNYLGFIMPEVKNGSSILSIYLPKLRQGEFPDFNWQYLHLVALNIARTVADVHKMSCIIGDLKDKNFLIDSNASVYIVDTDSFQIHDCKTKETYYCSARTDDYTPPELIDKDHVNLEKLQSHDRFGLGVLIYFLLFGYHPYHRVNNSNLTVLERMKNCCWPHDPNVSEDLKASPLAIPLNITHPKIQECFHKCFTLGRTRPNKRPSAIEWVEALAIAIRAMVDCPIETGHKYSINYGRCHWCDMKEAYKNDIFPSTDYDFTTRDFIIGLGWEPIVEEYNKQAEIDKQRAIEKQKEIDKRRAIEKQKEIDERRAIEKQKEIDKQRAIEKQRRVDKQKEIDKKNASNKQKIIAGITVLAISGITIVSPLRDRIIVPLINKVLHNSR